MILVGDLIFCMQCFVDLGFVGNTFFLSHGVCFFCVVFCFVFCLLSFFFLIEFFVLLALMVTCLFSTTLVVVRCHKVSCCA